MMPGRTDDAGTVVAYAEVRAWLWNLVLAFWFALQDFEER